MPFLFLSTLTSVVAIVVLSILAAAIKILRQYERAVVFTLGRFGGGHRN